MIVMHKSYLNDCVHLCTFAMQNNVKSVLLTGENFSG